MTNKQTGRSYSVLFETYDGKYCGSSSPFYVKLINNCIRNSSFTCSSYESATEAQTFYPGLELGDRFVTSWAGDDIGNVTHIEIGFVSGENAWCLAEFAILIDSYNWLNCSFDFMQYFWFDSDCSLNSGYDLVVIELSKICTTTHYNSSNSSLNSIPNMNATREYSLYFDSTALPECSSSASVNVTLINNCTFSWNNKYDCDIISYKTKTVAMSDFTFNTTKWLDFTDSDIGEITNLLITANSDDGWCFDSFGVLIDDETNIWSDCSMDFMGWYLIDNDCSQNGGDTRLLVDVSENSVICSQGMYLLLLVFFLIFCSILLLVELASKKNT